MQSDSSEVSCCCNVRRPWVSRLLHGDRTMEDLTWEMTGFNQIEMRVLVYRNHLNSDSMQHKIPSLIAQHQHAFNTPVLLALIKQKFLLPERGRCCGRVGILLFLLINSVHFCCFCLSSLHQSISHSISVRLTIFHKPTDSIAKPSYEHIWFKKSVCMYRVDYSRK